MLQKEKTKPKPKEKKPRKPRKPKAKKVIDKSIKQSVNINLGKELAKIGSTIGVPSVAGAGISGLRSYGEAPLTIVRNEYVPKSVDMPGKSVDMPGKSLSEDVNIKAMEKLQEIKAQVLKEQEDKRQLKREETNKKAKETRDNAKIAKQEAEQNISEAVNEQDPEKRKEKTIVAQKSVEKSKIAREESQKASTEQALASYPTTQDDIEAERKLALSRNPSGFRTTIDSGLLRQAGSQSEAYWGASVGSPSDDPYLMSSSSSSDPIEAETAVVRYVPPALNSYENIMTVAGSSNNSWEDSGETWTDTGMDQID